MLQLIRQFVASLRRRTTGAARFVTRLNQLVSYLFNLLVWSRIFTSHLNRDPVTLPNQLLATKEIYHRPPTLNVIDGTDELNYFTTGFAEIYAVLFANLREADLLSQYRHAVPGPAFRGVYLWDSAFIAQIWKHWDLSAAQEVLQAVIDLRDGQRLQHVVSDFSQSLFTQPPLIAWSAQQLMLGQPIDVKRDFYGQIYQPLAEYHHWLTKHRQLDNGLYFWEHPYESGVENAPRFSNRTESVLLDTRPLAAPDMSSYVALQLEALAEMAAVLGHQSAQHALEQEHAQLIQTIDQELWHEADSLYYDRHSQTGAMVQSKTIASLMPLWAGVPDQARAEQILRHMMRADSFSTLIPLPSVALNDPEFEPDMWRGPVWINTAFAIVQGLNRYGFTAEASEFAFRLCAGVYKVFENEGRIYEFYDPVAHHTQNLNRKKGNLWKAITLGRGPQKEFVGWSGLVNTLMIEQLFGLHLENGLWHLRPAFPPAAVDKQFRLALPAADLQVQLTIDADQQASGFVATAGQAAPVTIPFGKTISIHQAITTANVY